MAMRLLRLMTTPGDLLVSGWCGLVNGLAAKGRDMADTIQDDIEAIKHWASEAKAIHADKGFQDPQSIVRALEHVAAALEKLSAKG